jgi:putative ABC transport system permease protein
MFGIFTTALRHKVWFDLWGAKQRTFQAILTIAIGAFVVGAIFGAWGGIGEDTRRNYAPTRPPSVNVRISPPADEALIESLRADPRLAAVEGVMVSSIEWRGGPGAPWEAATLQARDDYTDQRLALLQLEGGAWPTGSRVAVERGFPVAIGDRVELRIDGNTTSAPVGGVFYNLSQPSAALGGSPTFYASRGQFAALTGQDRFGQILAAVPDYTPERAAEATEAVQARLRAYGFDVQPGSIDGTKVADPNRAFFQDPVESVGVILQSVGIIAVALGLLLVYNTVTAIVTQQTSQIGELKAIGATSRQILLVYFAIVFAYGLAALLISVPLGLLAANAIRQTIIAQLGLTAAEWIVRPTPILYQVGICLVAPLAVAALPVLRGARITVREAMSAYGLSGGSRLDEVLARLGGLPRAVSLALSNAFRNLGRVATTQLALAGAGLTFMAVNSARVSLTFTLGGVLLQAYPYQIQLDLAEPASLPRVEQVAELAGVAAVEGWRQERGTIRPAGEPERASDLSVQLSGVPVPTASYSPVILRGRALGPGDTYAIVLHERLADDLDAEVGDWVTIQISDPTGARGTISEQRWEVVGVLLDITLAGGAIVPRETLFDEVGGHAVNRVQIKSADPSEEGARALAAQVRSFYEGRAMAVAPSDLDTAGQRSANQLAGLTVVISLLLLVALIVAAVGAISLNGTLSISVLERRREIGVLRAIGTTPGGIRTQFVTEGLAMGLLSWLIGFVLSYPAGYLTTQAIGASLRISVIYLYDWTGVWLWLVMASAIAVVASLSPAQQAIRTSVQESLAYE